MSSRARTRQNRYAKKQPGSENLETNSEQAGVCLENTGMTQATIHSQDEKKVPTIMLDKNIFGSFEDGKIFCLAFKDRSQKLYFVKRPEYLTEENILRESKISIGSKYLAEQGIATWPKTLEAQWSVLDDEARKEIVADTVTIVFKNQYFSMRDMFDCINRLDGELLITSSMIRIEGLDFKVQQIVKDGVQIKAGVFSSTHTKHVFCSQSAKLFLLFEVAKETFMLSSKKNVKLEDYFMYLKNYFDNVDSWNCSHDINVIFYAKVFFPCIKNINELFLSYLRLKGDPGELLSYQVDKRGRIYRDFFQRISLGKYVNSEKLLALIRKNLFNFIDNLPVQSEPTFGIEIGQNSKKPFIQFRRSGSEQTIPILASGDLTPQHLSEQCSFKGSLSNSSESCILEAVALIVSCCSLQNDHKCLKTSGYIILALTPGDGLYHSEEYFARYSELRALSLMPTITIGCFERNIYGHKPAFISLDDELVVKSLISVLADHLDPAPR